MKAIVNSGPGEVSWQDLPAPEPPAGWVRVRTSFCGICATDLEMIRGWKRTGFPAIPGHEWSGVVDALGSGVAGNLLGQACVAENVLSDGGEVGFEHPGGYGQFLVTEARNVRLLPAGFALDQAALIEPLAVCVRAMGRLAPANQGAILILGDGPIGLLMLSLLKRAGTGPVTLVGGRATRLALASECGATATINYHHAGDALAEQLRQHGPFATVVEASGSPAALSLGLELAAKQAKILLIGDYGAGRADFPWNQVLHRELHLIGSNASAGAWDQAVALAVGQQLPLGKLISRCLPARRFLAALDSARHDRQAVKVLLDWRDET